MADKEKDQQYEFNKPTKSMDKSTFLPMDSRNYILNPIKNRNIIAPLQDLDTTSNPDQMTTNLIAPLALHSGKTSKAISGRAVLPPIAGVSQRKPAHQLAPISY